MTWLVTRRNEGEAIPAGPSVSRIKISGASTSGRASVVEMVLDAGWDGPPPHIHDEIDHVWFVVTGQMQVKLGDDELDLSAGDVAWIPHGQPHTFATGPEPATMVQFDTPRPLDAYFRDLAEAFPRGTRPDPLIVGEIMARHDTRPIAG